MTDPTIRDSWETGVLPWLSLAPDVATPLLGSVLFGVFEHPPLIPFVHGPAHHGKHALAAQAAELHPGGIIVVDDSDRRELADAIRSAYNGMTRITSVAGPAENPPAVIAVGESWPPDPATANRTFPLHLEHPIPLSDMAHALRTPASLARQAFGAAFQAWLAQQDHDELYDRYLDTWRDSDTEDRRLLTGRTAAAYGLALLRSYLGAAGVDHDPAALLLPDPGATRPGELPDILDQLRTALPAALEEGEVQLLNSTYTPQKAAPVVGKLAGSRVLLMPSVTLRVLHPAATTVTGLGAALEQHGFLRRPSADSDVRTTVTKIEGKAQRVWDVDCSLFGGIPALLGDTYDLEYFTRTRTLSSADAHRLNELLAARRHILITGRANAGKSTLLRALLNSAPIDSRRLLVGHPDEQAALGAIGEWETTTPAAAPEAFELYQPDRVFFDDLRDHADSRFLASIHHRAPFAATIHARSLGEGINAYVALTDPDDWINDFTLVHIERDGITWNLEFDETETRHR